MSVDISFHLSPVGVDRIVGFKDLLASVAGVPVGSVETQRGFDNALRLAAQGAPMGSDKVSLAAMRVSEIPAVFAPNENSIYAAARAFSKGERRVAAAILGLPAQGPQGNTALLDSLGGLGDGLEQGVRSKREDAFLSSVAPRFLKGGPEDAFTAAILAKDDTGKNDVVLVLRKNETPSVQSFMIYNDEMTLSAQGPTGTQGQVFMADPKGWLNNAIMNNGYAAVSPSETLNKTGSGYVESSEVRQFAVETVKADRFGQGWMSGVRRGLDTVVYSGEAKSETAERERALTGDSLATYVNKAMRLAQHRFISEMNPSQGDLMRNLIESGQNAGKLLPTEVFANAISVVNQTVADDAVVKETRKMSARQLLTVVESSPIVSAALVGEQHRFIVDEVAKATMNAGKPGEMTKSMVAAMIDGTSTPSVATALRADGLDKREAMMSLASSASAPGHVFDKRLDALNRYFKEHHDAPAFNKMEMRYIDVLNGSKVVDGRVGSPFGDIGSAKLLPPSAMEIDSLRGPSGRVGDRLSDDDFRVVMQAKLELSKAIVILTKEEIENQAVKMFLKTDVPIEQKRAWMADVAADAASVVLFGDKSDKAMTSEETVRVSRLIVDRDLPVSEGNLHRRFTVIKDSLDSVSRKRSLDFADPKAFVTALVASSVKNVVNARRVVLNPRPLARADQRVIARPTADHSRAA